MISLSPHDKARILDQAKQLMRTGQLEQARIKLQTLLVSDPTAVDALLYMSRVAYELGDRTNCLSTLHKALKHAPQNPRLWANAAERFQQFGLNDDAQRAFDTAIALDPKDLRTKVAKALYLQTLGQFDDAEALFRKLLKSRPDDPELYRIFLGSKKLRKGDPLIRQMTRLWANKALGDAGRMHLGFALARALEDSGATSKVFGVLKRANAAQLRLAPDDHTKRESDMRAMRAAQDVFPKSTGPALPFRPVFVTGMPRSGTTLVEQIVASHTRATAGGEMGHALKQAAVSFGYGDEMERTSSLSATQLQTWAETYARLVKRDTGASHGVVTDKSIQSHLIYGLIHHALPDARLIVVHRDPRDMALSIYKNYFEVGSHRYANDLAAIAHTIKGFRDSIRHWKSVLPDAIHEIQYDELVADPEPHARALIQAAGLEWEAECLNFHTRKGAVQTLSLAQVREPIHARRTAAWKAYEQELTPFLDAWGDTPWD